MKRRDALKTGAVLTAGLFAGSSGASAQPSATSGELNVALIGVGLQGRALINAAMLIKQVRFRAVCDVWPYAQRYGSYYLKNYGHDVRTYADHREMLDKEKGLDAVIVASPDFVHADQTNACLEAGRHVYCETMMAHTLDAARSMVRTMHKTGRLLQVGYQRRSNPRYLHVYEKLWKEARLTGGTTQASASWIHRLAPTRGWPRRQEMPDDALKQLGYGSMHEFRNWRWYRKFGGSLFGDFGGHQVDVMNWFLGTRPQPVLANSGAEPEQPSRWHDNVLAVYEYPTQNRIVQASCRVLTTTRGDGSGSHTLFMGPEGSLKISQVPKSTAVYRDPDAPDWDQWVQKGHLLQEQQERSHRTKPTQSDVTETGKVSPYQIPVVLDKPNVYPHLANFIEAIQGKAKLACPADVALATEACVHQTNQAIAEERKLKLADSDFVV